MGRPDKRVCGGAPPLARTLCQGRALGSRSARMCGPLPRERAPACIVGRPRARSSEQCALGRALMLTCESAPPPKQASGRAPAKRDDALGACVCMCSYSFICLYTVYASMYFVSASPPGRPPSTFGVPRPTSWTALCLGWLVFLFSLELLFGFLAVLCSRVYLADCEPSLHF